MPDEPEALALATRCCSPTMRAATRASIPPAVSCCSRTRTAACGMPRRSRRRPADRPGAAVGVAVRALRAPGGDRGRARERAIRCRHPLGPDRGLYSHLAALDPDPRRRAQPRGRDRDGGRRVRWPASIDSPARSTATTTSTPRAPTSCGDWAPAEAAYGLPAGARARGRRRRAPPAGAPARRARSGVTRRHGGGSPALGGR